MRTHASRGRLGTLEQGQGGGEGRGGEVASEHPHIVEQRPSDEAATSRGAGFLLVCCLVALDLALTNIAVSMLAVAIQQCIIATNPAFTVTIESIVRRKLAHPMIYLTICILCVGPVVAQARATRRTPHPPTRRHTRARARTDSQHR